MLNLQTSNLLLETMNLERSSVTMGEKIHSGQFMISKYDEESDNEDTKLFNKTKGYNFESSQFKKNFVFSNGTQETLEIDGSLQKMFQFLSIAMSGKITNPKWNSFKGVKFQKKDKIRLNNIIWREYHMQFVKKIKPVVVQFASPLTETPQIFGTVVLEGKYWKRKNNIIVDQYKKWREFSKHKFLLNSDPLSGSNLFKSIHVQRNGHFKFSSTSPPPNLNDIFMDLDLPYWDMSEDELTSEIMQPQLTNLQPRMDSSIDFLNDFLCSPQKSFKSQKMFSSETCLNAFDSSQKLNLHSSVFGRDSSNYFQNHRNSLFTPSNMAIPEPNSNQFSQHNLRPDIETSPTEGGGGGGGGGSGVGTGGGGLCKTPNLLSILLQPISTSGLCQISENKPIYCATIASVPNNNSLIASTLSYTGCHSRSQTSNSSAKSVHQINPVSINSGPVGNFYQDSSINYQTCPLQPNSTPSKYKKSKSPSLFNQSIKLKHNLSANNVVQQYLDELSSILTSSRDQNKISKAALLHKASEQIKRLRNEKYHIQSEIASLQNEIDTLQNRFSVFCSQLPATGVCLNSNRSAEGRKWFDEFVMKVSSSNWKFYIFCMMFESLFTSYNNSVSTLSMEALAHNVASWLEKECSLMKLRLIVINGMRTLSRKTSIVHNPKKIIDEVKELVSNNYSQVVSDKPRWSTFCDKPVTNSLNPRDPDQNLLKQLKYQNIDPGWPHIINQHNRLNNNSDNAEI